MQKTKLIRGFILGTLFGVLITTAVNHTIQDGKNFTDSEVEAYNNGFNEGRYQELYKDHPIHGVVLEPVEK